MSLQNIEGLTDVVRDFPPGKNVRIKIEGLAVCRFDATTANPCFVDFLQFVRHHQLRLTIVKIAPDGTNTDLVRNHPVPPAATAISITGSDSVRPNSYLQTPPGTGEFPLLERILHLSRLHSVRFSPKSPHPDKTILTLRNVSFCTNEVTWDPYKVRQVDAAGPVLFGPIQLCRAISGYMNCPRGTVTISGVPGNIPSLNIEENGLPYKYEITLSNHCIGNAAECRSVIGTSGRDINFLYQILDPEATPVFLDKQVTKTKIKARFTSDVAACLPGMTEPIS